jgi:hypothetical protein
MVQISKAEVNGKIEVMVQSCKDEANGDIEYIQLQNSYNKTDTRELSGIV